MLAIVIPYYKLTFFEETLQSLSNQTDKSFKVYIGDDASPEDPSDLLKKYKGKFDFLYHRFESNLGGISLTQQWERCIALTKDELWIMILGDDDYMEETLVASWYKNFYAFNNKSNIVRFATKTVNEETQNITEIYTHPIWELATDSLYRRFKGQTRSSLSEHVFSKESFLKYGFRDYPLAWHSDDKAWIDFSENKPIYTINEAIVFIRVSNISITGEQGNNDLKNIASVLFLKDIILQKLEFFTKHQQLELLYGYEIAIKRNRKITLNEWFILGCFYLKKFNVLVLIKFVRRIFRSIFNL